MERLALSLKYHDRIPVIPGTQCTEENACSMSSDQDNIRLLDLRELCIESSLIAGQPIIKLTISEEID